MRVNALPLTGSELRKRQRSVSVMSRVATAAEGRDLRLWVLTPIRLSSRMP